MIYLTIIDYGIIIFYLILLFIAGNIVIKKNHNVNEFFLAGRRLTLPVFVASLVSTWYGGILGVGELAYNYGIVNWLTQGFFWYISYLVFAFFLANKIRKSNLFTIPDQLEKHYDKKSRILGAIFNWIMVTPAPYIFSMGILINLLFGLPQWVGIIASTIIMIIYTIRGGFSGVIYADLIQFFFMMIGVSLAIPYAFAKYGGMEFLKNNLPEAHLTITGTWTIQMILVWGFISFWTLVDPGFYQKCYATKDSKMPKKGVLISILFWVMFDICTTFIGLYARAAMPGIEPTTSLAVFSASILPAVIKGIFFTGVIATVMSTIDSFIFIGAINLSHDLYKKVFCPKASNKEIINATKIGIIITGISGMLIALYSTSLVSMWYTIGTIGITALLVPVLAIFFYSGKKSSEASFWSIILGTSVSLFWLIFGWTHKIKGWPSYPMGLEPLYPGLFVSLLTYVIITIIKKRLKK